jgi:hypothetical protein
METDLKEIEQDAVSFLLTMNADDRQQVRSYYTALWLWNRLDQNRWNSAKLALCESSRRKQSIEVDHVVAWDLWKRKLEPLPEGSIEDGVISEDLMPE